MATLTKEKGIALGSALVGLLMGGSVIAATGTSPDSGSQFFKFNELSSGYQLAATEEGEEKKCGGEDKKCGDKDKKCGEEDKKCGEGDKKCGDKDSKCAESGCS